MAMLPSLIAVLIFALSARAHNSSDPTPCKAFYAARTCIANNCGWCLDSNSCTDLADAPKCQCSGSCNNCFRTFAVADGGTCNGYSSCSQCTADRACGWNVYEMKCVFGDAQGACYSSDNSQCSGSASANQTYYWQYGSQAVCPQTFSACAQYVDCAACTTDPACGWNTYQGLCAEGNADGACWGDRDDSCSGSAAATKGSYWQYGAKAVCPANHSTCQQYLDCELCTADPACGWNVYGKACVAGNADGACASSQDDTCSGGAQGIKTFYWQYGPAAVCPSNHSSCYRYLDCETCTASAACGWNSYQLLCTPGNQLGSCFSSEDSSCSGKASHIPTSYWHFGAGAVCPSKYGRCTDHLDCTSCVNEKACGWNGDACVDGNSFGTCASSQAGSIWDYGTCS